MAPGFAGVALASTQRGVLDPQPLFAVTQILPVVNELRK